MFTTEGIDCVDGGLLLVVNARLRAADIDLLIHGTHPLADCFSIRSVMKDYHHPVVACIYAYQVLQKQPL
jgi:hypothetical protein